ncbi:uncharacterized protein LOC123553220 isoform X2 [Mercenaria mercenaria]|uniref:uncharacterized protein LOC123553220 isoform X2 n=1 Tax=Mercenaria mercenaria TaxID=6596 RepID=UPI001E1D9073|nr:uncharacterized protein LOC123553220 isoform X2 [Mercenaria mercenaria]
MNGSALCIVCVVLCTCIININSFLLPKEGGTISKRCMPGPNGICVTARDPPHCDHPNCINGGCVGWKGACAGICYCYGQSLMITCPVIYLVKIAFLHREGILFGRVWL